MTWSVGFLYCSTSKFLSYSVSGPVYQPRAASFDVAAKMLLKVEGPSKDCKACNTDPPALAGRLQVNYYLLR